MAASDEYPTQAQLDEVQKAVDAVSARWNELHADIVRAANAMTLAMETIGREILDGYERAFEHWRPVFEELEALEEEVYPELYARAILEPQEDVFV